MAMLTAALTFITSPVSVSMFGVAISATSLIWALCCFKDGRRWSGLLGLLVAGGLFYASSELAFSLLRPPFCPPGQHLHGAAGRVLWCAL